MNTNDHELLELAAKAAGVELKYDTFGQSENADRVYCYWDPLTDDGDALRLAVKLGFDLQIFNGSKNTTATERKRFTECREAHGTDPYAATRHAIVRAAAEIGKQMEDE
jgi:L-alanine-DL-glutamate epimerase-like enolase superfamily enzyme